MYCEHEKKKNHQVHKSSRAVLLEDQEHPCCDIITTNFYLFYNFQIISFSSSSFVNAIEGTALCGGFFGELTYILSLWFSARADKGGTQERRDHLLFLHQLWPEVKKGKCEQLMMCKNHA
jgi:hypothetical protein